MNTNHEISGRGCLVVVFSFIALIAVIIGLWLFIAFNKEYRRCVQLKNGLNLGYNAVFDLSQSYFEPNIVPKFPDGTPLVNGNIWPIYVTKTTLYGVADDGKGGKSFDFAWRKDSGLIRKKENPRIYEKLVSEAGEANPGIKINIVGTGIILREFMKRPEYQNQWCRTKLITW